MTQHSNINKNKCNRHYEFIYIKESEEKYGDGLIDFFIPSREPTVLGN